MQLDVMSARLSTFCPGLPQCPHEAPHAGSHKAVQRPEAAYCAPGRCYCPAPPPEPPPAHRGPRWGKYGQADGELVADLMAELKDHLAALKAAAREASS